MQEVGKGTRIGDTTVDQAASIAQMRRIQLLFLRQHVDAYFGRRQILPKAIVEFASNASPLFILYAEKFHRKPPERSCSLLNQRLKRVMRPPESVFCAGTFAEMIADLILAASGQ